MNSLKVFLSITLTRMGRMEGQPENTMPSTSCGGIETKKNGFKKCFMKVDFTPLNVFSQYDQVEKCTKIIQM